MTQFTKHLERMEESYKCACNILGFVPDTDVFQDAALTKLWELIFDRLCRTSIDDDDFHKIVASVQKLTASMNQRSKIGSKNADELKPGKGLSPETLKLIEQEVRML